MQCWRVGHPFVLEIAWVAYRLRRLQTVSSSSFLLFVCTGRSDLFISPSFEGASFAITGGELWR